MMSILNIQNTSSLPGRKKVSKYVAMNRGNEFSDRSACSSMKQSCLDVVDACEHRDCACPSIYLSCDGATGFSEEDSSQIGTAREERLRVDAIVLRDRWHAMRCEEDIPSRVWVGLQCDWGD
jgi:hypothetical protein